jgi:hypothetical protein
MRLRSKNRLKAWTEVHPERRSGLDRRALPAGSGEDFGADRRLNRGRRHNDLPNRRWPGLLVSAFLGATTALLVQVQRHEQPPPVAAVKAAVEVEPETRRRIEALRDEAEALTPMGAWIDERANERWLPLLPELERMADAPETPSTIRKDVDATLAALGEVGIRP